MTQYHLIQARPAQSEAVPIQFMSESVRLMLHRLAVGVAATVAIACQAEVSAPLPTVAVSPIPVIGTATYPNGDAVYHSDRFSLTDWVQQSDWFVTPRDITATTAAGQPAIAFQSSEFVRPRTGGSR